MSFLILKHGTCSCAVNKIKIDGLKAQSCLTDDNDIALYYGECAADECSEQCGGYDVIEVRVDTTELRPDINSYEEPLTFFQHEYTTSEREWHEMVESGEIPSPKNDTDYTTSLDVVKAVVHKSAIRPEQVVDQEF